MIYIDKTFVGYNNEKKGNLGSFEQLTCRKTIIPKMQVPKQILAIFYLGY